MPQESSANHEPSTWKRISFQVVKFPGYVDELEEFLTFKNLFRKKMLMVAQMLATKRLQRCRIGTHLVLPFEWHLPSINAWKWSHYYHISFAEADSNCSHSPKDVNQSLKNTYHISSLYICLIGSKLLINNAIKFINFAFFSIFQFSIFQFFNFSIFQFFNFSICIRSVH